MCTQKNKDLNQGLDLTPGANTDSTRLEDNNPSYITPERAVNAINALI